LASLWDDWRKIAQFHLRFERETGGCTEGARVGWCPIIDSFGFFAVREGGMTRASYRTVCI
jgi:hypothetical protein